MSTGPPFVPERPGAIARLRGGLGSTRARLAATLVAVLLLAGVLIVLAVRTVLLAELTDRVRTSLVQEKDEFDRFLALGRDPRDGGPVGRDLHRAAQLYLRRTVLDSAEQIAVIVPGRSPVHSFGRAHLIAGDPEQEARWAAVRRNELVSISTPDGPAEVLAVPVSDDSGRTGTFVVANFVARERAQVGDALRAVTSATAGAVLLVGLLAWSIAGRVLRPLRDMTATARHISEQDLSRRLPDPGGRDEVSTLVRTFNTMLDRLEGSMASQRAFLHDAGHDLRTPLTIVGGHLEQLAAGLVPEEERAETLALVADEVARMSRLVEDLMVLARAERPDFLRLAPVDLGDLAEGVRRRAEAAFPGPLWRARPGVGVVRADAERLTQALLNLVSNAARYSPPGAPVTVGTALGDGTAVLWVADSGPGVPPEARERVVRRFARGPERRRDGTGLGLAIATAIAEAHGGALRITDAVPEGGARVEISIPTKGTT
jgi:two-component system, OmpR family, sensor kinase